MSSADLRSVRERGSSPEIAQRQLERLGRPQRFAHLIRACTVGDGIVRLDAGEAARLATVFERGLAARTVCKFVPASGAASRMFKAVAAYLADPGAAAGAEVERILEGIDEFAFSDEWKRAAARAAVRWDPVREGRRLLGLLLAPGPLAYDRLPKALLAFHRYPEGGRTPLEEHLVEAARYARDAGGVCRLHFTVSEEHRDSVGARLEAVRGAFEKRFGVRYRWELSVQDPSTDSLAVDDRGEPFRDADGALVFRPGGHGALIENVALAGSDLVFVKNIDNVSPEPLAEATFFWKQVLGGLLVELQVEVFALVERLRAGGDSRAVGEALRFLDARLGVAVREESGEAHDERLRADLLDALDRPLRVCGMVRNTGEPGGGPFWVADTSGRVRKQIVETAEIDPADAGQQEILSSSTHFNPVDLVCAVRDREGRPYDLTRYVDSEAVFIVEKSFADGRLLRSVELPGLWNGAMADWNTVFVEVPGETFHPVKQLSDLLRPAHRTDVAGGG